MSEFTEKWGKKISEIASEFGKKTEDTIEIQKIKSEIRSLNRGNTRDFVDIGKAILEKYQNGEVIDGDLGILCEAIEARNEQIKEHEAEISKIKDAQ